MEAFPDTTKFVDRIAVKVGFTLMMAFPDQIDRLAVVMVFALSAAVFLLNIRSHDALLDASSVTASTADKMGPLPSM
jgi:hypothetical protein